MPEVETQSSALLTVDEVAAIVRCHPTTARRAAAAGDLRVGHIGHGPKAQLRIAPADVSRWLAAKTTGGRGEPWDFGLSLSLGCRAESARAQAAGAVRFRRSGRTSRQLSSP
jgi:hypothetical protein